MSQEPTPDELDEQHLKELRERVPYETTDELQRRLMSEIVPGGRRHTDPPAHGHEIDFTRTPGWPTPFVVSALLLAAAFVVLGAVRLWL